MSEEHATSSSDPAPRRPVSGLVWALGGAVVSALAVSLVFVFVVDTKATGSRTASVATPLVSGLKKAQATAKLVAVGLQAQVQRVKPTAGQKRKVVVRQTPSAGTRVARGSAVTIFVARGSGGHHKKKSKPGKQSKPGKPSGGSLIPAKPKA